MKPYPRVYAEIDLDAILCNMSQMGRTLKEGAQIMPVVKTDAYGHGAVPISRELEPLPMTWGYAKAYPCAGGYIPQPIPGAVPFWHPPNGFFPQAGHGAGALCRQNGRADYSPP